jgi:hypothetical protein
MSILDALGLSADDVQWEDLAKCRGTAVRYTDEHGVSKVFDPVFDSYEEDEPPYPVRKSTDEMCLSCPVQRQCFETGKSGRETGVYGGVYLVNGKTDRTRNEHKTRDVWDRVREVVGRL